MRCPSLKAWSIIILLFVFCHPFTFSSVDSDRPEVDASLHFPEAKTGQKEVKRSQSNPDHQQTEGSPPEEGRWRIGQIIIERVDVFDPKVKGEDRRLFKLINALHMQTREMVIRRELLFQEGDPYIKSVVEESARNLRKLPFLYTATIEPISFHDGVVDLKVRTQDSWTSKVGINMGRKGGMNTHKVSIADENFLGMGKKLIVDQFKGIEHAGTLFRYYDYQLLGSRWRLSSLYEDNTDGERMAMNVTHPFYSLKAQWAFHGMVRREDEIKRLYHLGEPSSIFREKKDEIRLTYGFSKGLRKGVTKRYFLGYSYRKKSFSMADPIVPFSSIIPENRKDSMITFHFERLEDSFIKVRRFHKFGIIEDFLIGNKLSFGVGLALSALGSTRNGLTFDMADSQGFQLSRSGLLFLEAGYHTRIERDTMRDTLLSFSAHYFNTKFKKQTIFSKISCNIGHHLDAEKQFLLGGDNGLRGYPARFLEGSRQLLWTLEDRIFTDIELFHLFNIGMALFFDTGITWHHHEDFSRSAFRSDLGIGLRVGLRRSALANVVHIDLAYPMNMVDGKRSFQLLVMTSETF